MTKKLFTYLSTAFCWLFYAGLVYTGFIDPNHQYLELLDNSRTLYLVMTIPAILLVGLVSAAFATHSEEIKQNLDKKCRN